MNALTVEAFDTTRHLAHAAKQASERGFDKITIVDAGYAPRRGRQLPQHDQLHRLAGRASPDARRLQRGPPAMVPLNISYQDQGGRLQRFAARKLEQTPANVHRDITLTRRSMAAMGATFGVLYPTTAMRLSMQPKRGWEFSLALAYNRWLANDLLPQEPQLKGMMYLPLHHGPECLEMIEALGDKPGIAGCVVASPRYEKVQSKGMLRSLLGVEERRPGAPPSREARGGCPSTGPSRSAARRPRSRRCRACRPAPRSFPGIPARGGAADTSCP